MVGNTTVFPFKFTQEIISLMRPPGGPEPNTCSAILWVFSIQLSKPTKSTHKNTETHYMSNTKSNPDTLIASFLLPWKVTNHSTGKEQPNNHKKPSAWILPVLQCLQNPTGFITLPVTIFAKSQKVKQFSTFRFFRFFEGKNRDFHGVTDTSQKRTQDDLGYPYFRKRPYRYDWSIML